MRTIEFALERVQEIASEWENPNDDIEPVLLARTINAPDEETIDATIMLAGMMQSEETKQHAVEVAIPTLLAASNATEATMVVSAYMSVLEPGQTQEYAPSEDPDRLEAVIVFGMDCENLRPETWVAYIGRDPLNVEVPTLSEFEHLPDTDIEGRFEGRFVKAIEQGLRASHMIRTALDRVRFEDDEEEDDE